MPKETVYLGEFEELLLMVIAGLANEAYGVRIRETLESSGQRITSTSAVYTALERLQNRGLISSQLGDPTPERGGRRSDIFISKKPDFGR